MTMTPEELGTAALGAILAGSDMTLHLPKGEKWPRGWPGGELLSVTDRGDNYSFDPVKLLRFMQRLAKLNNTAESTKCKGMEIEPGIFSGCDASGGDCPVCGL